MIRIIMALALLTAQAGAATIEVNSFQQMELLLAEEDCDKDKKITIEDRACGNKEFLLKDKKGKVFNTVGTYHLSNLLQELKLAETSNKIETDHITENPVDRLSRSIRERFWNGLTRSIDSKNLGEVLTDSKVGKSSSKYLYVPFSDKAGFEYFKNSIKKAGLKGVEVRQLPEIISSEFVNKLGSKHGLLSLALESSDGEIRGVPYVVPGGRFNEMYGWDSYFHALGLLKDGKINLAKGMVDNFVYEITHYGKILNANRTYYLTRSQPPFLTSMINSVYGLLPQTPSNKEWLRASLIAAIKEYEEVWMGKDRLTSTGLSRYAGFSEGIPPEVEPGHFNDTIRPYAVKKGLPLEKFTRMFAQGQIQEPELIEFFLHDRAVRESGHDTTYRWRVNGKDRCADFITVDLNSLLYKYELDLADLIKNQFNGNLEGHSSEKFTTKARVRKELIRKYLWDPKSQMFYDYNWVRKTPSEYLSATTLYPLWSMLEQDPESRILSKSEAQALVKNALKQLEQKGGLSATSLISLKRQGDLQSPRQWEYPNGWAPHQIIAWQGLKNYQMDEIANRLIYKWLYMITKNAMDYHGTIPEKYDVVERSHKVFAEYGNVGTDFSYITTEGFGWMNASYQLGLSQLSEERILKLKKMEEPVN